MDLTIIPLEFNNNELLTDLMVKLRSISILAKIIKINSINIEESYNIERRQFDSTKLLELVIKEYVADKNEYVITITEKDIFIPVLTYVFGLSQLNGNYSVISTFRLNEELYLSKPNYKLLLERTYKEILHELGHNKGLKHCYNANCVMYSATTVETIDVRPPEYCNVCLKNIIN